jgi:sigma-B regulation protein RsbU (phosphoserine phosphatase)
MHRNNELFFTIWYGVYDIAERVLVFAAAGHHPAYLLPADTVSWPALPLSTGNPIVGMLPDPQIATAEVEVPPGSTLHLFSDGVFEVTDREGRDLGLNDIVPMLASVSNPDWAASDTVAPDQPRKLYDRIRTIARPGPLDDDFSALVFRFP